MPCIDAVRRGLSDFDLDGLKNFHNHIVKTTIQNKVFRKGTIDGLKVVAIDATVGSDPHIIIGQEMLEPKKDSSDKNEGEITGAKRLVKRLYKEFHHFADIIVVDALYCKSTWIKEVLSIGMDVVIRVKDERLNIVKDALSLYKNCKANNEWTIKNGNKKYTVIKAWDEDNFEMSDSNIKVKFLKFIEEIHNGDKIEFKEAWIITTDKIASAETLWKIMHKR